MGQNDLRERLQRRPFRPFRIHVSDGATYDIHHPDQVLTTFTSVLLATPGVDPSSPAWDELITVSLLHITRLEPITPPAPPSAN
jgi:hypothetical protein